MDESFPNIDEIKNIDFLSSGISITEETMQTLYKIADKRPELILNDELLYRMVAIRNGRFYGEKMKDSLNRYFKELVGLVEEKSKNNPKLYQDFHKGLLKHFPGEYVSVENSIEQIVRIEFENFDEEKINNITQMFSSLLSIDSELAIRGDFYDFIFSENVVNDDEKIKELPEKYKMVFEKHNDLFESLKLEFLSSSFFDLFTPNQLGRIIADRELQSVLLKYEENSVVRDIVNVIVKNNPNWVMELNGVLKNINKYEELLVNIENSNEYQNLGNDEFFGELISVLSESENYFGIKNFADVKNFTNIKNEKCKEILKGNDVKLTDSFNKLSDIDKKKFAYFQYMYGIDIKQAKNIVKKYGEDIEKLNDRQGENVYIQLVIDLKEILQNDKNQFFDLSEIEHFKSENKVLPNYSEIESSIINIYEKCYRNVLYSPEKSNSKKGQTEYDGKKIPIYNINPKSEFYMFARVEGAYTGYEEPENFYDDLMRNNIKNHGNCKSFISQNMLGLARTAGPIYGYYNVADNSFLLQAPWDIVSSKANSSFSTASVDWNSARGIQYRTPKEMIDNTRHYHNEIVSERLIEGVDGKYSKDKPDYVIYIKENKHENYKKTEKWRMTQKAASQLDIPIVIMDKESIVKNEFKKFEHLKKIFLGKIPNDTELNEYQILNELIVSFENNRISVASSENIKKKNQLNKLKNRINVDSSKSLKDKYFSETQRQELIDSIIYRISEFENSDIKRYQNLKSVFCDTMENELSKQYSNNGTRVGVSTDFWKANIEKTKTILKRNYDIDKTETNQKSIDIINSRKGISIQSFIKQSPQNLLNFAQKLIKSLEQKENYDKTGNVINKKKDKDDKDY